MPFLHPDDVLARTLERGFERDGDVRDSALDQWHERVLARQLDASSGVSFPYDELTDAYPVLERPTDHALTGFDGLVESARTGPAGLLADDSTGLSLEDAAGRILAQIETLEAERSQLDGRIVDAYGALHTVTAELYTQRTETFGPEPGPGGPRPAGWRPSAAAAAVSVEELVLLEVTAAIPLPYGEAARRLRLGAHPRRYASLRALLGSSDVSLLHAGLIAEACADLAMSEGRDEAEHTKLVTHVTERVLAPMPDGSHPTHAQIRSRLARVIRSLSDPDAAAKRRAKARARRAFHGQVTEDGMGVLTLHTGAEQVVAILDHVEHLARAMRQAGDPRSLDQLRADLAAEALLRHGFGPCATHASQPDPVGDAKSATAHSATSEDDGAQPDGRQDSQADGRQEPESYERQEPEAYEQQPDDRTEQHQQGPDDVDGEGSWCGCGPSAPPANVWIVVPFEVATGMSNAPCELPGHGWVTAEHARAIITAPGSTWRWLAVDRVTGHALELGAKSYRPTKAMVDQLRAIDGHCRAPGCTIPAKHCDIDHHVRWPEGPTAMWNTGPLHRGHHGPKTLGLWTATPLHARDERGDPSRLGCPGCDGCNVGRGLDAAATLAARSGRGLAWRTLAGREYVTYPKAWTDALHDYDHPEHTPPNRRAMSERADERAECESRAERDRRLGWDQPPPF